MYIYINTNLRTGWGTCLARGPDEVEDHHALRRRSLQKRRGPKSIPAQICRLIQHIAKDKLMDACENRLLQNDRRSLRGATVNFISKHV